MVYQATRRYASGLECRADFCEYQAGPVVHIEAPEMHQRKLPGVAPGYISKVKEKHHFSVMSRLKGIALCSVVAATLSPNFGYTFRFNILAGEVP
jgi:hypothetical protein